MKTKIEPAREAERKHMPLSIDCDDNINDMHIHDKGGMIVIYDSHGRMLEVNSVYEEYKNSTESMGRYDSNDGV